MLTVGCENTVVKVLKTSGDTVCVAFVLADVVVNLIIERKWWGSICRLVDINSFQIRDQTFRFGIIVFAVIFPQRMVITLDNVKVYQVHSVISCGHVYDIHDHARVMWCFVLTAQ